MSGLKWLCIVVAGFCTIPQVWAQQYHHNAWMRTTLSYAVTPKFKMDGEFQHRRQSGFDSKDCLDENLMYSFRSWVHYQQNESVRFSVSPFAYFSHFKIIQQKNDALAVPNKEARFTAAVDLQHEVFRKFFIITRNAVEYRMFSSVTADITRMRNKFGVRYDPVPRLKAGLYAEFLVNLIGTDHFFDHKRHVISLDYALWPGFRMETGYARIVRLPPGNREKIREDNIFLNFTFQLPRHHVPGKTSSAI